MGWMSWAVEIMSLGNRTIAGMPAAAQYAANAAEVSPVEAQATAGICWPSAIIWLTMETKTVMPKSLNEPVWLLPHCFIHKSSMPSSAPKRSAQSKLLPPSYMETTFSSSTRGQTISFLPHTELP